MSVLIAVGSPEMSSILRRHLAEAAFDVIESDVFHRSYLNEIISLENPSMLILHDVFLPSDFDEQEKRDAELLELLNQWRIMFEGLRVVFLCERDRKDPFLGDLAARNVLDIFHVRNIPVDALMEQLSAPPRYANVAKFGVGALKIEYEEEHAVEETVQIEPNEETNEEPKKETIEVPKRTKEIKSKPEKPPKEKKEKFLFSELKEFTLPKLDMSLKMPNVQIHVHKETEQQKLQVAIGRKIIVVVSPFQRMGSTFIAHQLAHQLAKHGNKVAYFENPFRTPYTYDRFAGHLKHAEYLSEYSNVGGIQKEFEVEGVTIQALNPSKEKVYKEDDLTISRFLRMFLSKHDTPFLVVDIGSDTAKGVYEELIEIASHVYVVMEPDIPKLEWFEQHPADPQFSWIHRIKQMDKTKLVINRFCYEAVDALPNEEYLTITSIFDGWVFQSQLNGSFSFGSRKANTVQDEEFYPLFEDVVGKDFLKKSKGPKKRFIPRIKISTS